MKLFLGGFVCVALLLSLVGETPAQNEVKFLDGQFASLLCSAWNRSELPKRLGRAGSEWIDSADSKGRQVMVMNRSECTDWPKVQLVIEAKGADGNAVCVSGGEHDGKSEFQWKFEPTTEQWADFSDGFGVMDMPGIMSGFVGPYGTAMNNIGNFEMFFAATGNLALNAGVDWSCHGTDMKEVEEEVASIDASDVEDILRGG